MTTILETQRLLLRELNSADIDDMRFLLQNPQIMYAWEHTFTDGEVWYWLLENIRRYADDGHSYWAAVEKDTGAFIGMIGLLNETADKAAMLGVGYLLNDGYWGRGFAAEGVRGCLDLAFRELNAPEVYAQIRPKNQASRKVAEGCGMRIQGRFIRHYRGKDIPHLLYCISRADYLNR